MFILLFSPFLSLFHHFYSFFLLTILSQFNQVENKLMLLLIEQKSVMKTKGLKGKERRKRRKEKKNRGLKGYDVSLTFTQGLIQWTEFFTTDFCLQNNNPFFLFLLLSFPPSYSRFSFPSERES